MATNTNTTTEELATETLIRPECYVIRDRRSGRYFVEHDWDAGRPVGSSLIDDAMEFETVELAKAFAEGHRIIDRVDAVVVRRQARYRTDLTDAGRERVRARRAERKRNR